ncbi:MAG: alcohol dehydrogenase catalytic domain-containing protein [Chloroflexi bacterium]|nr:alcohol dehydrogenase catalytic domain-containing protein [Chloroflexota bacterium]
MSDVRAMVLTGPNQIEQQRFPRPETDEDSALLRIEASGICGTDYESLSGEYSREYPVILGHEPLGVIEEIGERAAARWGVTVGDRVVVQPNHGCGACRRCNDGARCNLVDGGYGSTPAAVAPALWGGFAEYMHLARGSKLHKVPDGLPLHLAALANPIAAGFGWAVRAGRLQAGDRIAILGAGQRGLASTVAASHAGADFIAVTGLARDEHKLALARQLGAHATINVDAEDPVDAVLERTDGEGVDVVVDLTPYSTEPVVQGIEMLRPGGTMVLAGLKGTHRVAEFDSDAIIRHEANVRGVRGVGRESFVRALRLIASGRYPVQRMHTHEFPLEEVERGIRTLSGETGEPAISITVEP